MSFPSDRTAAEDFWAERHADGYAGIFYVCPSTVLQDAVRIEIEKLPEGSNVLIHGAGTDNIMPQLVASFENVASVTVHDFPSVITQRAPLPANTEGQKTLNTKVSFLGMDGHVLGTNQANEYDAILSINSFVAPTRGENQSLLRQAFCALKPQGRLIAMVPTVDFTRSLTNVGNLVTTDPMKILKTAVAMVAVPGILDAKNDTLRAGKVVQHYPSKLALFEMLESAGFDGIDVSKIVLDDEAAAIEQQKAYGSRNPALPVFEYFVTADKPEFGLL